MTGIRTIAFLLLGLASMQFSGDSFVYPDGKYFRYQLSDKSAISIAGTSTVNEFTCYTHQEYSPAGGIVVKNENGSRFTFQSTSLNILVKSIKCDNNIMDLDMYKALKSDVYPYVTITLKQIYSPDNKTVNFQKQSSLNAEIELRIAGVTKKQYFKISGAALGAESFHFKGTHTISLKEYDVEPPTALFGVIRVHDGIEVNFDLYINTTNTES